MFLRLHVQGHKSVRLSQCCAVSGSDDLASVHKHQIVNLGLDQVHANAAQGLAHVASLRVCEFAYGQSSHSFFVIYRRPTCQHCPFYFHGLLHALLYIYVSPKRGADAARGGCWRGGPDHPLAPNFHARWWSSRSHPGQRLLPE
jgi:hypothetical protein